ncbi:hypothetical protein [uncultured Ruminococcus sp.]|uniref:hypothetical protein n=1 Tax=uncultured Ruminococcus sp. TaxID=165186 RepID=UPI0026DADCDD|nr:hypothetical protein [uncultured Ruminococcus sp.]
MFAKILPYFLPQLSEQHAAVFPTDGQDGNGYILRGNGVLCPFLFVKLHTSKCPLHQLRLSLSPQDVPCAELAVHSTD